jgi:hypothetical protein
VIQRLNTWLRLKAWPDFDCMDCVGVGSCYCAYHGGSAPGEGPADLHLFLRWLHGFIFIRSSPFWKDL